jgi:uncharacterized peroxidase-related enzyme
VRSAATAGATLPPALEALAAKVRDRAAEVTDEDIAAVRAAGYGDDEIFELALAAALGASAGRLDRALRALGRDTWAVRLACVTHGHALPERVFLQVVRLAGRREPADIIKTLTYRPEFFGLEWSALTQEVMRGDSPWTIGERELFAALTSSLNQCVFWTRAHGAVASRKLGDHTVDAVLRDWRTAPVGDALRAALGFVERLSLVPDDVGAADIDALRAAGLSDDAIEDAAFVCVLFTTYVRLADTFEFDIPPAEGFALSTSILLNIGYAFAPPLAWIIRRRG